MCANSKDGHCGRRTKTAHCWPPTKAAGKITLSFIKAGIVVAAAAAVVAADRQRVEPRELLSSVENTLRACAERFCAFRPIPNPIQAIPEQIRKF